MKKHTLLLPVLTAVMLAAPLASLEAATILEQGLNNTTTPDSKDSNLTYTTLTNTIEYYSTAAFTEGTHSATWEGTTVSNNTNPGTANIVFSFSLAPDPGASIDLNATNTVTWDVGGFGRSGGGSTSNTAYSKLYIASDSSFTTILATSAVFSAGSSTAATNWTAGHLDYNATGITDTLYFGFAFGDATGVTGKGSRLDNIVVNGVTVVPEPTAALLGGFGVLLLLRRRRA